MSQTDLAENSNLFSKIWRAFKQKGIRYILSAGIRRLHATRTGIFLHDYAQYLTCKLRWTNRSFVFNEQKFKYFYRWYNLTVQNERAVEVPIVLGLLENNHGTVLEVGNVLSHYFRVDHDIVDKYEVAKGVTNEDAAYFKASKRYDLIICISTMEHIGWDETPRLDKQKGKEKILCTVKNFRQHLNLKGKILLTAPIGYNPYIDELLKTGEIGFTHMFFLKRISKDNRWVQTDAESVKNSKFGDPFPFANGLFIGVIET
jgi:hypothetical protein